MKKWMVPMPGGFRYMILSMMPLIFTCRVLPIDISVSLFHSSQVRAVLFSAHKGDYRVMAKDGTLGICPMGKSWYIIMEEGLVKVRDHTGRWHQAQNLFFTGKSKGRYFGLKPVQPVLPSREYLSDLHVRIGMNSLLMLNRIGLEKYIMGVNETEAGADCNLEYYKVQAILCRTFALKNLYRHEEEGFHLCDGVHCQAYGGRHIWNENVEIGVEVTDGLVLMDSDSLLLNALYHSNSGGETCGAENVWLKGESYLKPVLDPFSLDQRSSVWEKKIPAGEWFSYLSEQGVIGHDFTDTASLVMVAEHRNQYYCPAEDTLKITSIRDNWHLRSDFFDITRDGSDIVLKGRGYGHGVGLSQEGAMNMARRGYHYTEILNYYYYDIRIIHYMHLADEDISGSKVLYSY